MYHNFIGIDVSKNEFHVAIHGNSNVKRFANTAIGFKAFKKANQPILADALVVLEATGGYEAALLKYLQDVKIAAHRANTRIVKNFIRSLAINWAKVMLLMLMGLQGMLKKSTKNWQFMFKYPTRRNNLMNWQIVVPN